MTYSLTDDAGTHHSLNNNTDESSGFCTQDAGLTLASLFHINPNNTNNNSTSLSTAMSESPRLIQNRQQRQMETFLSTNSFDVASKSTSVTAKRPRVSMSPQKNKQTFQYPQHYQQQHQEQHCLPTQRQHHQSVNKSKDTSSTEGFLSYNTYTGQNKYIAQKN